MYVDSYGNRRFPGLYRGLVFDNRDPLEKGRVKVQVPQVLGDAVTDWAWAQRDPGAPEVTPSVGDGVWMMFEGGDPSYPVWVGTFVSSASDVHGLFATDISATLPATWDEGAATIGVDQDAFTHISTLDYAQFDTAAAETRATGKLWWDSMWETLAIGVGNSASLQVGQEFHILVQNDSGAEITDGTLVMGEIDNNGRLKTVADGVMKVVKAVTDGTYPGKLMLGITTEHIANGDRGMITTNGYINGISTSAYENGDILYNNPSVAGGLTTTAPTAPNLKLPVAVVTKKSANGSIYVRMTNGLSLDELSDVTVTSAAAGNILVRNAGNTAWVNSTKSAAGLITTSDSGTVSSTMLADSAVTSAKIASNAITSAKIADGTIVNADISSSAAIDPTKISGTAAVLAGATFTGNISANNFVGRNVLLNGGFEIWQRGTTFSSSGYCADRWYWTETGTCTVTQVTTGLPDGFSFGLEASATTLNDSVELTQTIETQDVYKLRGKVVTFSFYLNQDANMAATAPSGNPNFNVTAYYSTTSDARTAQTTAISTTAQSRTAGWIRATHTFTVPVDAVGLQVAIRPPLSLSGLLPAKYTVTGAQLEVGSIATPYIRNSPNFGAELSACKRYYERLFDFNAPGFQDNSSLARGVGYFSVEKRVTPAISASSATVFGISARGTDQTVAATDVNIALAVSGNNFRITYGASTVTAGEGLYFYMSGPDSSTKYLELDAEL